MIKDILMSLLPAFGPSGSEKGVAEIIRSYAVPSADDVHIDALGNLYAIKHGNGKRILLTAHMDSIGFAALDANESGYLPLTPLGKIDVSALCGSRLLFQNGVNGILCPSPATGEPKNAAFYADIGASCREDALVRVPAGSKAVITSPVLEMGDRITAPFIAGRGGCAVLLEILERLENSSHEIAAVFTVQKEIGTRGAIALGYGSRPDFAVSLDASDAQTVLFSPHPCICLDKGPALRLKDTGCVYSQTVMDMLRSAAEAENIPYQIDISSTETTDASAIRSARSGIPTGALCIPCRYRNTACETVSVEDLERTADLLIACLENVPESI